VAIPAASESIRLWFIVFSCELSDHDRERQQHPYQPGSVSYNEQKPALAPISDVRDVT
jgi:hypothetical protein